LFSNDFNKDCYYLSFYAEFWLFNFSEDITILEKSLQVLEYFGNIIPSYFTSNFFKSVLAIFTFEPTQIEKVVPLPNSL